MADTPLYRVGGPVGPVVRLLGEPVNGLQTAEVVRRGIVYQGRGRIGRLLMEGWVGQVNADALTLMAEEGQCSGSGTE